MKDTENWTRDRIGSLQDQWPKTEDGQFEKTAFLQHCSPKNMEEDLTVNLLAAYGIPCVRIYPGDGRFGRVMIGASGGGADLYVPESRLEEARQICLGERPDEENL